MFYSPSTGGFYIRDIHGERIPPDAVEITEDMHASLMRGQEAGQHIVPDEDGIPVLRHPQAIAPQVVSKFQAKAALMSVGLLAQVEQMMADPSADPLAVLAWTEAQEFRRTSPTVLAMGAALGLDDAALDSLFIQASSIEA